MKSLSRFAAILLVPLAACGANGSNSVSADNDVGAAAPPPAHDAGRTPGVEDNEPASLPEPKGPIDPKSAEGAGQVMQHYGALIEQGKWQNASNSWTDAAAASQFRAMLEDYPEVHLLIGTPTDMEGAAGSIFITVPTTLDLVLRSGERKQEQCSATLRRINDVPGSTAEQRLWHIQSIAC